MVIDSKFLEKEIDYSLFNKEIDCFEFSSDIENFNQLKTFIDFMFNFEVIKEKNFICKFKNLSTGIKIKLLNDWLSNDNLSNSCALLNIINLIKTYNTLSDDFFKNDNIMFKDITELLDVKIGIKENVNRFIKNLTIWYFSIFISIHKNDSNYLDDVYEIPIAYKKIILTLDFYTLSGICSKNLDFNGTDLKIVKDSYLILSTLSQKNNTVLDIYDKILNQIKE